MRSGIAAVVVALVAVGLGSWRHAPLAAQTAPARRVIKITGDTHLLVLWSDGTVGGWGNYRVGQLGPLANIPGPGLEARGLVSIELPRPATDIATGASSSFALLDDGTVMAWGDSRQGQLGLGPIGPAPLLASSTQAMEYRGIEHPRAVAGLEHVVSIAAGGVSGYAVLDDGTVRAWGGSNIGDDRAPKSYSGPPSRGPAFLPVPVPGLERVARVSAGSEHVLALTTDGRVLSWGSNFHGALGRPPRQELPLDTVGEVPGLTDVTDVAAGLGVSTALKEDGTVWVWGSNLNSQFGFGVRVGSVGQNHGYDLTPRPVPGVANVVAIAVGRHGRHTGALLRDGTLRAWGNNDWGQTGSGGDTGFQAAPITPKITAVAAVFTAGRSTFAVRTDGSLWAWGGGGPTEWPLRTNVRVPAPAPPDLK